MNRSVARGLPPLILEVRANEYADRGTNPHVPYGVDAIVSDALECADAGAAIYHWHPRDLDGREQTADVGLDADVIGALRQDGRLILHSTLGFTSTQGDVGARIGPMHALRECDRLPDMIPVDIGAIVADRFDWESAQFVTDDRVLLNRTGYLRDLLRAIGEIPVAVMSVVWSPGAVRSALALRASGLLAAPAYWQLGFTGSSVPGGLPATSAQLEAFLDVLPPGEPWTIHVRAGDGLSLAAAAIERGGNVSIGLGDDPYERLGKPTNAQLVHHLVRLAEEVGRPLATSSQARAIVGLPQASGVDRGNR